MSDPPAKYTWRTLRIRSQSCALFEEKLKGRDSGLLGSCSFLNQRRWVTYTSISAWHRMIRTVTMRKKNVSSDTIRCGNGININKEASTGDAEERKTCLP